MLLNHAHSLHPRCSHLNLGLTTSLPVVRRAPRAQAVAQHEAGLYAIPGLASPEDWQSVMQETQRVQDASAHQLHQALQDTGVSDQDWAAACAQGVLMALYRLDSLLLPAQHCYMHHPDAAWKQAASEVLASIQPQEAALQRLLNDLSQHPAFSTAHLGLPTSAAPASSSSAHTADSLGFTSTNFTSTADRDDEAVLSQLRQAGSHLAGVIRMLQDTADLVVSRDGPLLVFHNERDAWLLGEELMAALPHWPGGKLPAQQPRQQTNLSKQVVQLNQQHQAVLNQIMAEKWWLKGAPESGEAAPQQADATPPKLTVSPCGPQQQIELPDDLGCVETGPPVWLSGAALAFMPDALQQQQQHEPGAKLRILPLTLAGCLELLSEHPQPLMRRLVFDTGVVPRLRALADVLDALRRVRHLLAQVQGNSCWSQRTLATGLAGGPDAVMSVLQDMATAWKWPALEQVKQLHSRQALSEEGDLQPWDYDFYMQQACDSKFKAVWQRIMTCFPLEHLVSTGMSGVLAPARLALRLEPLRPGELWQGSQPAGLQPQPVKVMLHELEQERTAGPLQLGKPLGIVYVIPDPGCQMPYTMLVQPQAPPGSLDLQQQHQGLCRVAVHLPADNLVPCPGAPSEQWCLAEPHGLRIVMHEMGHAISYLISCQGRASSRVSVAYAAVEVAELAAHVLERCAGDVGSLLCMSVRKGREAQLNVGDARALALLISSPNRTWSPLEMQQHVMLAMADVLMHTEEAQGYSCVQVMNHVWEQFGATQQIIPTARLVSLMPGLVHLSGGRMSAYPQDELLAAAVWQALDLAAPVAAHSHPLAGRAAPAVHDGWMAVRKHILGADAYSTLDRVVRPVLGPDSFRPVGNGVALDLAAEVFQDLEL